MHARKIIKTTSDRLPSPLSRLGSLNSAIKTLLSIANTRNRQRVSRPGSRIIDVLLVIGLRVPDRRRKRPRVCLGSDTGQPKLVSYTRTAAHGDRANATELEGEAESGKEEPVWS
jgi:hypothetical protein